MKVFEYDVLADTMDVAEVSEEYDHRGRLIPGNHSVRFWITANSFIEIRPGEDANHILVRAMGHQTQLEIEPEVSNTIRIGLK